MQDFPHHYKVTSRSDDASDVTLSAEGPGDLHAAPPIEFDGPGDKWSPESLLVAAVTSCFILSFKAIARASRFEWLALECEVNGILDKQERLVSFTEFQIKAVLRVTAGVSTDKAERLLNKAEQTCMISNSLTAQTHLLVEIIEE